MKKTTIILLTFAFVFSSTGLVYAAGEAVQQEQATPAEASEAVQEITPVAESPSANFSAPPAAVTDEKEQPESYLDELDDTNMEAYRPETSAQNSFKKEAGLAGSLRVDNFTGAAVYNINLEVPPGRKGMQPSLNLYYNSHDKFQGSWVGLGWSLELGSITRSSRIGTTHLYISNEFSLFLNGKSYELVLIDEENNIYGAKTELDYLKIQYNDTDQSWTVTDTLGNRYYFGQTAGSRLDDDPANPTKIYKWNLNKVQDLNGNYYTVEYFKDGDNLQIYPSHINYTGHNSASGPMDIYFNLTGRNDIFTSYQSQFRVVTAKLLDNVSIKVNNQDKIKYDFEYLTGQNDVTSLLHQVIKSGYQNSQWQALPATSFAYQVKNSSWQLDPTFYTELRHFPYHADNQPWELNSDSWADLGPWQHNGSGWEDSNWNMDVGVNVDFFEDCLIGDLNGDRYPDCVTRAKLNPWLPTSNWEGRAYINNPVDKRFDLNSDYTNDLPSIFNTTPSAGPIDLSKVTLADINGDGLADLIYANSWSGQPGSQDGVYINNGSGFETGPDIPVILANCYSTPYGENCYDRGTQFIDVNGDGLNDIFFASDIGEFLHGIYLNNGNGWEAQPSTIWTFPDYFNYPGGEDLYKTGAFRFTDLNADGLIDFIISYRDNSDIYNIHDYQETYLNNGSSWERNTSWDLTSEDQLFYYYTDGGGITWEDMGVRLMDINDDGAIDTVKAVCANSNVELCESNPEAYVNQTIYFSSQISGDLLANIDNGYDGLSIIEYQASGRYFDQSGNFKNPKLPFNLQTVKQITVEDSGSLVFTTTYEYQDGAYYVDEVDNTLNQFAGFGIITEQTGDKIIRTYYHQGSGVDYYELGEYDDNIYKKGRVFREEILEEDAGNQYILSAKINTWESADLGNSRAKIYLDASVDLDYNADQPADGLPVKNIQTPGINNPYLDELSVLKDFSPQTEPQLIPELSDEITKHYYLGQTAEGKYKYKMRTYSMSALDTTSTSTPPLEYDGVLGRVENDCYSGGSVGWIDLVEASSATYVYTGPSNVALINNHSGSVCELSRIFLPFQTLSLPDEAIVTSADLYVTFFNTEGGMSVHLDHVLTENANINGSHYGMMADTLGGSNQVGSPGRYQFGFNQEALSWVDPELYTIVALRGGYDFPDPYWPGFVYLPMRTTEYSNPNDWPSLEIEYTLNQPPSVPTNLQTEGQTNPEEVTDQNPEFTAIYNDNDPGDLADRYRLQVIEVGGSYEDPLWDSGPDPIYLNTPIAVGQRSEEIEYGGGLLDLDGWQYFWRIKFWDNSGEPNPEGLWSEGADYFYMDGSRAPNPASGLLAEGEENPVDIINLTPAFTAIYTDPNPIDYAKWYRVQVDNNSDFSSPEWDSEKTLLSELIYNGGLSEEIVYSGSPLSYNGLTYYWRIKFWDDEGLVGAEGDWSEVATFDMFDESSFLTNAEAKGVKYVYDDFGNVVQQASYGKVNAAANGIFFDDESDNLEITNYEYAVNEANHIYSAPKRKTLTDQITDEASQTDLYYDGLDFGLVDKVNLTKEDLDQPGAIYESDYNDYGLVTDKWDPLENHAAITYDSANYYPYQTTNALNQVVTTTYDLATGQILETIDPNGLVEERDYDAFGRLIEVRRTNPDAAPNLIILETYEYNDTASPFWVKKSVKIDDSNWVDSYTYFDGLGRVIQIRSESETDYAVVSYEYNENGNLSRQTLPIIESGLSYQAPNWSTAVKNEYNYDSAGRVLTEVTPVGTTTYSYDGWKTTVTDANGNYKNYYRDAYGQLIQVDEVLDSVIHPTTYEYNYLGKLVNITDSQNNQRNFSYDSLGRLTMQEEMHRPGAGFGTWTMQYDAASNLTGRTDAKNQTVTYTYDDLNRVLTEDASTTAGVDVSYTYDLGSYGAGRLTEALTPNVSTGYQYDIWGRVTAETKDIYDHPYTTSYAYNLANQPLTIIYPDGFQVYYNYNMVGQTYQVDYQELGGPIVPVVESVGYSPLGQISQINYINGTQSTMTYDINQAYRLINKQTIKDAETFQDIDYTYDNVGNITDIIDNVTHELAKTAHFVYDDLYRLTHAEITDDFNQTTENFDFEYDILGNLREKSDIGPYEYDYENPYQASLINGTPYHYDANGNLLKDGVRRMGYDYMDRLTSVKIGENITNYHYDHSKTRVAKVDQATHDFKFYPSKYYEVSRNGNSSKYVFLGNQRLGIIEKIGTSTQTYLNFSDHLNSSSVVTDDQGNVTNLIDYMPYGTDRVNVQNQSFNPSYKFTDQENDPESGLMYYGARYYEQNIGKFTQTDPVAQNVASSDRMQEVLANPQRMNEYSYALNNPIRYVDPDGQAAETVIDIIALALSLRDAAFRPTIMAGVWLGLDAIGLAVPVIPSVFGYARHSAQIVKIAKYFDEVAEYAGKSAAKIAGTFLNNIFFKQNRLKFAVGKANDSLANLVGHFHKHQKQFGVKNFNEYYNKANDFIDKNTFDNKGKFFSWVDEGGDTNFFNTETKELLGRTSDNEIRTYQVVDQDKKLRDIEQIIEQIKVQ